jgi:acyl-[acyl-carrier-protein] desaturase
MGFTKAHILMNTHCPQPTPVQVADRSHESGDAAEAQEYLVKLPDRIRKLSERAAARKSKAKTAKTQFSWIFNRTLDV